MRITFQLTDSQYAANDRAGLLVGLPLTVQLDAGPLLLGRDAADSGWFDKVNYGQPALKPFSLAQCAFCGRISQLDRWRSPEGAFCQALLDCGVPLRIDVLLPEFDLAAPGLPDGLRQGDWLVGVAALQGLLAFDPGDLLWQPVEGAIVDIQRLNLDTLSPAFGNLRWLNGLPRQSFAPDQVFVTVECR